MKILEELKHLSAQATPAPWRVHFETGIGPFIVGSDKSILSIDTNGKDLLFISEARNHIDKLLAVAEAAKAFSDACYQHQHNRREDCWICLIRDSLTALEDEK